LKTSNLTIEELLKSKEIVDMRNIFTRKFFETWENGFKMYIDGEWNKAWDIFEETKTLLDGYYDGPSETLIEVMSKYNFKAPNDWKGIRKLTEKWIIKFKFLFLLNFF